MDDGSLVRSTVSGYGPIFELRFNTSGSYLLTGSANGAFELVDTSTWQSVFKVPPTSTRLWEADLVLPSFTWLDDENLAVVSPEDAVHCVNCWQFGATFPRDPRLQFSGHEKPICDLQYDMVSKYLATASEDHAVRLWRLDKPSYVHEFRNHSAAVKKLAFQPSSSADSRILASASFDGTVALYNVSTFVHLYSVGDTIHSFPGDRISCLTWSPDSQYFCTGDLEGVLGVWSWRDLSSPPRAYAIWAPDRVREDQMDLIPNGTNGHNELDRPVYLILWQRTGQSFVVCRENRKVPCL
jgi:WD40 repeat protein